MQFDYRYSGHSAVRSTAAESSLTFQPDVSRPPVWFSGSVDRRLPFREAISALHDVVVSDLRFKPKDRTAYLEWRKKQDEIDWDHVLKERSVVANKLDALRSELYELQGRRNSRWSRFYEARDRYFKHLWRVAKDVWWVLDPVVTVHPDQVFFEAFSEDESSYGRLSCGHEVFTQLGEFSCGTTNVDYSESLYNAFQKIRDYKQTSLVVDPGGFEVQTDGQAHREVKIDLPDSWVRGFLQVSSAMTLPGTTLVLHPMDVANLCTVLRRNKERHGPRSLRFILRPGQPIQVRVEPFDLTLTFARSPFTGSSAQEIRVWGRRRLHVLERLIPVARSFTVTLVGSGMPSFWVADLGDMQFTLGLSGWTANDWSSQGNFDLLTSREHVDDVTRQRVFEALADTWLATVGSLSAQLDLDESIVHSALGGWVQAGRAIYDIHLGVYRKRELSRDPLPMSALRFSSPQEQAASDLIVAGHVRVVRTGDTDLGTCIEGTVHDRSRTVNPSMVLDSDLRMRDAHCTCDYFVHNKLKRGPCPHLLALRSVARDQRGVGT